MQFDARGCLTHLDKIGRKDARERRSANVRIAVPARDNPGRRRGDGAKRHDPTIGPGNRPAARVIGNRVIRRIEDHAGRRDALAQRCHRGKAARVQIHDHGELTHENLDAGVSDAVRGSANTDIMPALTRATHRRRQSARGNRQHRIVRGPGDREPGDRCALRVTRLGGEPLGIADEVERRGTGWRHHDSGDAHTDRVRGAGDGCRCPVQHRARGDVGRA